MIGTVIPTFLTAEGIRLIGASNVAIISSIGPISTIGLAYVFWVKNYRTRNIGHYIRCWRCFAYQFAKNNIFQTNYINF